MKETWCEDDDETRNGHCVVWDACQELERQKGKTK